MNSPVATVEPNGHQAANLRPTEPGSSRGPAASGARFAYASGSRPLPGYTIKRGVGHGGFGEVYYAVSDAGKEVAIKLIRRNLDVELRGIKHCLNLKHPNLLSIYDLREDSQGDNWVVMEYVNGQCLEEVVVAHPHGMPVEQALSWFFGMAAGVACLHDHGIVHRDLKPGNIFSDEGVVKLGDYGLSKFISCSRRSGQTESVGTVHYMAPEIANGRYGKEIDIYALGVILFEMLTGRVPFEGESVGEVLMKHLTTAPDVSILAEPYRSVVCRALEKDPAKRFSSVSEMLAALPRPAQPQVHVGPLPSQAGRPASHGSLPPIPPAVPVAEAVDEEPILRTVRHVVGKAHNAWVESGLNTPMKIIVMVVAVFVLLKTAPGWIPLTFMLLFMYGIYRIVRAIVLSTSSPQRPVSLPPAPPARQAAPMPASLPPAKRDPRQDRHFRRKQREAAIQALVLKPPRERITDLVGSLLGSSLVVIVMSVVAAFFISFKGPEPRPEQIAWILLVSLVGSWAVIIPSKFWEGREGDTMIRRFILLVIGLGVGVVAYVVAVAFNVPFPKLVTTGGPAFRLPNGFYSPDGIPLWKPYLAAFGTLLPIIRWWRQSDPLRPARMSLWTVVGVGLMAWIVSHLWQFPLPWLLLVACVMSVAVQIASPWVTPRMRRDQWGNQ